MAYTNQGMRPKKAKKPKSIWQQLGEQGYSPFATGVDPYASTQFAPSQYGGFGPGYSYSGPSQAAPTGPPPGAPSGYTGGFYGIPTQAQMIAAGQAFNPTPTAMQTPSPYAPQYGAAPGPYMPPMMGPPRSPWG